MFYNYFYRIYWRWTRFFASLERKLKGDVKDDEDENWGVREDQTGELKSITLVRFAISFILCKKIAQRTMRARKNT